MTEYIFSFCIYGSNPKYCLGMLKNLEQIREKYPNFTVHIAMGNDVPEKYELAYNSFSNVRITKYNYSGNYLMVYRYYPIDLPNVNTVIIRDADSRFTKRDVHYINKFLEQTKYRIFTIRDHHEHNVPIMGGQWGIKNIPSFNGINIRDYYETVYNNKQDCYQNDQRFLVEFIYNQYIRTFIAYTHKYVFNRKENYELMVLPRENEYDFCGNVVLFDETENEYNQFKFY